MNFFRRSLAVSMLALIAHQAAADTPANALIVAQNIDDIVTIDPASAYEFTSGEYVANTYDQLVHYDATDTTELVGGLATSWDVDAEAKAITFTLRDGVTFSSGNPLTGADVVGSWKRVLVLNMAPAFILTQLGWTADNIEEMVTAEGNTVTVRYVGDFAPAFVLNVLASRPASIVDVTTAMANEVDGDLGHAWLNEHSAGTGPFVLNQFRPGEMIRLTANPAYYGGAPAMEQVLIRHVPEAATQRLMLESGDIDMAKNLTPDQVAGLENTDGIDIETYPQSAVHWLSFNQKVEVLSNPAFWEAARYLVDYNGMADTFLKGQMIVHQAFWPMGYPGALDDTPFTYDPEKARQILADAGIQTPIKVTLDVINSNPFTDMAQALQATFAQAGIEFEILPGTGSQVITRYRERSHQAMLLYWGPDFMDPHSNAKAFAYNANNDDDHYASTTTWRNAWMPPAEMNALTMAALSEVDPEKRLEMYLELQREVQQESPIVVMFQAVKQVAMADDVHGFVNGASSDYVYYRLVTKD
ncbi:putative periplasmic dipeptide transport protein dppA [Ketogulonicigenium robustum]|uniref:Putative periplasmic dipeptide transport protein dppA n=1 Tax=Ketogulonicigenium robustum TaxID=92947 RepID=A0A1W6NYE1_9RHOB|nr:ABC transporter substrate-binding protein [Ketogulonicigenium robustum]ARO14173.1 putative periplasmic dipeptide transport protein dppA [Ketogulonicigenium robustum]